MQKIDISNIILGTGNYQNIKFGNTVSITGDGGNAWGYFGPSYKKLAPKLITYLPYAQKYEELQKLKKQVLDIKEYLQYRKEIEDEYIKSYYELILQNLDIISLLKELENMYGENIILLCHEPIDEFCHRRLFADYIELKTGIYIPEISVSENGDIKKLNPIRYKSRLLKVMNK